MILRKFETGSERLEIIAGNSEQAAILEWLEGTIASSSAAIEPPIVP